MDKLQLSDDQIILIDEILTTCWEHLQDLKQPQDTTIYLPNPDSKTLTLLSEQGHKPITDAEALALLESWITQEIITNNKVFLYTCRDNAEISIESLEPDDDISLFDCQIKNHFYIGYD